MSAEFQGMSDETLRYWLAFHAKRIEREAESARKHREPVEDDRRSEEYVASLIAQCELSIYLSERALGGLRTEAARRGIEVAE